MKRPIKAQQKYIKDKVERVFLRKLNDIHQVNSVAELDRLSSLKELHLYKQHKNIYQMLTFRAPWEVAHIEPQGTVFLVSTTDSYCVDAARSNLWRAIKMCLYKMWQRPMKTFWARPCVSVTMTNPNIGRSKALTKTAKNDQPKDVFSSPTLSQRDTDSDSKIHLS